MGALADSLNELHNWDSLYFDAEAFRAAHDRHVAYHERKVAEALAEQRRQAMNPEPPI